MQDALGAAADEAAAPPSTRSRVLRSEAVGVQRPISLSIRPASPAGQQAEAEAPPPPDYEAIKAAAREEGLREGQQQGYADGLRAAEEQMSADMQRLSSLVGSVMSDHEAFYRTAERQVIDLALQIAQKVIEREIENVPDLAVNVIHAALEELDARLAVRVRISPEDEEIVRRRWSAVVPAVATRLELVIDPKIQGGGAIIETTQGTVDAQIETKLAQLSNALWGFSAAGAEESGDAS